MLDLTCSGTPALRTCSKAGRIGEGSQEILGHRFIDTTEIYLVTQTHIKRQAQLHPRWRAIQDKPKAAGRAIAAASERLEAGYFPGILLYLTYWFRQRQLAHAFALFGAANPVTSILGAPLSGVILDHVHWFGIASWRWLLILEGIPAILGGVLTYFLLPGRPAEAKFLTLFWIFWFESGANSSAPALTTGRWQPIIPADFESVVNRRLRSEPGRECNGDLATVTLEVQLG